jgi:hypothetical protein
LPIWPLYGRKPSPEDARLASALVTLDEAFQRLNSQLVLDEKGWAPLAGVEGNVLPHRTRVEKAIEADLAIAANPLIKRGVNLRCAYIWGSGVTVTIRDEASTGQDIQQVLTEFQDDPSNAPLWAVDEQIQRERELCGPGEVWLALPTAKQTGRVRVRPLPAAEMTTVITDPEDRYTDWFYLREYTVGKKPRKTLYPALGYYPAVRPLVLDDVTLTALDRQDLRGVEIRWDSPVRKLFVNELGGRGLGDVFASLPSALAYTAFMEAWHKLMLSLARFVWRAKARPDKAQQVARKILEAEQRKVVGGTTVEDPATGIEAISKTGATFDADSGRPLAGMVAAGLGLPVTMLLADPGVTGARAVAETLDQPTELEFGVRRKVWARVIQDIVGWVIDSKVRAGKLRGTISRDGDREVVTLPDGDERTVVVDWPPFDSTPVETLVKAITEAQQTQTVPPLVILRLLLKALEVEDADEILDQVTTKDGRFIPLDIAEDQVRRELEDQPDDEPVEDEPDGDES